MSLMPEPTSWDRRRLVRALGGIAGLAALAQVPLEQGASAAPRGGLAGYPFTLGVASGDPSPDGFVLWTRLAPEPLAPGGGGMPHGPVAVDWRVATDEGMRNVVRRGTVRALPELAHAVHVEPEGLLPDREYWYQFRCGGDVSPVGRTRTLPAAHTRVRRLSFAFASCQNWADGYYSAYRNLAEEDLDLVVHLGDYVYEGGIPADGGYRRTPVPAQLRPACRTLDRWRLQYALYKSDPDLQRAHARFPWIVTWDDHEVQNDYAARSSQYEGDITALRAAAYQAYYEHQPLRRAAIPRSGEMRLYRRLAYGDLAEFSVLDGRQYRDVPPCGWGEAPACEAAYDPSVTMLGERQERWLLDGLAASGARWNVLANNVMMARLDHDGPAGDTLWHDAWDGFPAARTRVTDHLAAARVSNPVVITGDWHSTFVNDIRRDFDDPDSPVVATEFVGTSISSNGDGEVYGPYYGPMIRHNPHIRFFDGDRRGYVRCAVDRREWRTDLRMVGTVGRPDVPAETFASFVVEEGAPGAHRL
ncbi:alkaline phosphatase D family protein [Streptomyces sp. URMC 129]|uniref:alkaline phosphatase D family protein n=1 Tax=Streptomyces sp. URMC 129 TaxID=3423407 RepID=UPI003F1B18DD